MREREKIREIAKLCSETYYIEKLLWNSSVFFFLCCCCLLVDIDGIVWFPDKFDKIKTKAKLTRKPIISRTSLNLEEWKTIWSL